MGPVLTDYISHSQSGATTGMSAGSLHTGNFLNRECCVSVCCLRDNICAAVQHEKSHDNICISLFTMQVLGCSVQK